MTDLNKDTSAHFQEPVPPESSGSNHNSSDVKENHSKPSITGIIKNAVKAPFQHKEKENSPALQEAVQQMEARKQATIAKMEAEGKDTSQLKSTETNWGAAISNAGFQN